MGNIGQVIYQLRISQSLSRQELAEDICTEKYIYLIEKGQRTPSADLVRHFCGRLGADLFRYYEFLDCENPIELADYLELFCKFRVENNFEKLMETTLQAKELKDFEHVPWSLEIELNEIIYQILQERDSLGGIERILTVLNHTKETFFDEICYAGYQLMLSFAYQMTEDYERAGFYLDKTFFLIQSKKKIKRYMQIYITAEILNLSLMYQKREFIRLAKHARELETYQYEMNCLDRIHYTYFYLACAFEASENENLWSDYGMKMMRLLLVYFRPQDILYFKRFPFFHALIHSRNIPVHLKHNFFETYGMPLNIQQNTISMAE